MASESKDNNNDDALEGMQEHVSIVFIGHIDCGKSVCCGRILVDTGQIDDRTIEKLKQEAKNNNRESWWLSYVTDTNDEERARGKTTDIARAHFNTAKKRYTIIDAPGHKNYVPNMIGGVSQADVGVLVISARNGEFEGGFELGGQTREHAMLAKSLGLQKLIVLVNKMDDHTVNWSHKRYTEIITKLTPFLQKCGFNIAADVEFIPASALTGDNISHAVIPEIVPWLENPRSLFMVLDDLPPIARDAGAPLRMPVRTRYKDGGAVYVICKIASGILHKDQRVRIMPTKLIAECQCITINDIEVLTARAGESILIRLKGIDENDIQEGFILCDVEKPCHQTCVFEAQVKITELLPHRPIITRGYSAILHLHALTVECMVSHLVNELDKKTGKPLDKKINCLRVGDVATVRITLTQSIACDKYSENPSLARFTLRDEGTTIAIGKILRLKEVK